MKYKFLEVSPVAAAAMNAAVAPYAEAGWRVDRLNLVAPANAKKPSYALITLVLGGEAPGAAGSSKGKRRGPKLVELGELDWGDHPDVKHLELDFENAKRGAKKAAEVASRGGAAAKKTKRKRA